jgi:hypothetical protein
MKLITKVLLAASTMSLAMPAAAAIQVVDPNGVLTGARGVIVGSSVYNVEFVDGTCASVYGSCTTSSFDFTVEADARAAARSLLDQVFLDTPFGNFDSDTTKIRGCTSTAFCTTSIVFGLINTNTNAAMSRNYSSLDGRNDFVATGVSPATGNSSITSSSNFARFSLAPITPEVPEPATWAMMLVGFSMIGATARYRRRKASVSFA